VRPLSGVALVIAAGASLLAARADRKALLAAAAPLAAALGFGLYFCRAVTGQWTLAPWSLWARQYTPFDGLGIGAPATDVPTRDLPPHLHRMRDAFYDWRMRHTLASLPGVAWLRLRQLFDYLPTWLLGVPLAAGLTALRSLVFPAVFAASLFLLCLAFHASEKFYWLELTPALALFLGAGLQKLVAWTARARPLVRVAIGAAAALTAAVTLRAVAPELLQLPHVEHKRTLAVQAVEQALDPAQLGRALVFLRYPKGWEYLDLTQNEPDLDAAPIVRALDLGARNAELRARFPTRTAWLLDLATLELTRL
jgi:hypothetical protein